MQKLLTQLEAALQAQTPALSAKFADAATEAEIRDAEEKLKVRFPADLRAFLLCANGQKTPEGFYPEGSFVVPRIRFSSEIDCVSAWGYFLQLDKIVEQTLCYRELAEMGDTDEYRKFFGPVKAHHNHILITGADDPVSIALDLDPADGGHVGQVVTINDQPDVTAFLAPSLSFFFLILSEGFLAGRYRQEVDGTLSEN